MLPAILLPASFNVEPLQPDPRDINGVRKSPPRYQINDRCLHRRRGLPARPVANPPEIRAAIMFNHDQRQTSPFAQWRQAFPTCHRSGQLWT